MFERLTDQASQALTNATVEAHELMSDRVDTPHLVLGMLHDQNSVASVALRNFDIDLESARTMLKEALGMGEATATHLPFTPEAKRCLEMSLREALQFGHNYIGPEHLLLSIIRNDHGPLLSVLGIKGGELRREVTRIMQGVAYDVRTVITSSDAPTEGASRSVDEITAEIETLEERLRQLKAELKAAVKRETSCDPDYHHEPVRVSKRSAASQRRFSGTHF